MIAYHNDPAIKAGILAQLAQHREADQLVQGNGYWRDGKGCAVGCTLHSGDHQEYETRFGIPTALAHLEDRIFEGLPVDEARQWPERFMAAIRPGSDLSCVHWRLLHWLLTDESINPGINHPLVKDAVRQCADMMADLAAGRDVAASAAWSAAWSAENAAGSAAWSAAESAAESAESAAYVARSAAESAAYAVRSAAESAAESAAWRAVSVAYVARRAAWSRIADKLISLIEAEAA